MTVFLNILFIGISLLFFAGRLYEIVFLSDGLSGFLENAIVSKPLMLFAVFIMAVCCGVIIFGGKREKVSVKKIPVGIFGFASGMFFIVGAVFTTMDIFKTGGFLLYPRALVLGGIGLVILGLIDIKGKSKEKIPFVLVMLLPIFNCLNNLVYDIQTIYNTAYLLKCLSGIALLAFTILLFKAVYSKSKNTFMLLYIFALMNFIFTGAANLAHIVGGFVRYSLSLGELLVYIGFALMGMYSLFVAFCILPSSDDEYDEDDVEGYTDVKTTSKQRTENKQIVQRDDSEFDYGAPDYTQDENSDNGVYDTAQVESISRRTIRQLFARKDSEEEASRPISEKPKTVEPNKAAAVKSPYKASSSYKSSDKKGKKIVYKAPK